jgi:hypothetical protein
MTTFEVAAIALLLTVALIEALPLVAMGLGVV